MRILADGVPPTPSKKGGRASLARFFLVCAPTSLRPKRLQQELHFVARVTFALAEGHPAADGSNRKYNLKMSRIYIRQMKLRRWFPPGDKFSACVARLAILREDFSIEMMGVYAPHLKALDGNSAQWRRVYFWRNMVRTLSEIRGVLIMLGSVREFKTALEKQPSVRRKKYAEMIKKFERGQPLLKRIRDSIGGHVLHQSVEKALDSMDTDRWGFIEVGPILKKTHYKFTGELVVEILAAGVPEKERHAEMERQLREIAGLLPVFVLMEIVFATYVAARNLVE
ncbi:MAG TPA: hypothetical protein VHF01_09735 [Candidatus Acidoferrum sp.]|nr:hypothetical protein [Candidatus Acidoferrum sp.]